MGRTPGLEEGMGCYVQGARATPMVNSHIRPDRLTPPWTCGYENASGHPWHLL